MGLGRASELRARLEANLEAARVAMEAAQAEPWVEGSTGQLRPTQGLWWLRGVTRRLPGRRSSCALSGAFEPLEFNEFDGLASRRGG